MRALDKVHVPPVQVAVDAVEVADSVAVLNVALPVDVRYSCTFLKAVKISKVVVDQLVLVSNLII